MLRQIDRDLWVAEHPLKFMGIPVGTRMTVVKLDDGSLWIYSAIPATPELRAQVEALGKPKFLVAPNKYHHLFIGSWMEAHPDAQVWLAPGLPRKRPDLQFTALLGDDEAPWGAGLNHHLMRGSPILNETVFCHTKTKTLICCDLVHNLKEDAPTLTKIAFGALGGYGGLKTNFMDRVAARDREALKSSLEKIFEWDFERIVMTHGHVFEGDARAGLRKAYGWALG